MAENDRPVGQSYAGPSGVGRDSTWLTWEDLPQGKDQRAVIEDVLLFRNVTFQGGRTKERILGLKFKGGQRVLGLNATNRKILNAALGNDTAGWIGAGVALYVSKTQLAGQTVNCVRIREQISKAVAEAKQFVGAKAAGPAAATASAAASPAVPTSAGTATSSANELDDVELPWTEDACGRFKEACSALGISREDAAGIALANPTFEDAMAELNRRADTSQ